MKIKYLFFNSQIWPSTCPNLTPTLFFLNGRALVQEQKISCFILILVFGVLVKQKTDLPLFDVCLRFPSLPQILIIIFKFSDCWMAFPSPKYFTPTTEVWPHHKLLVRFDTSYWKPPIYYFYEFMWIAAFHGYYCMIYHTTFKVSVWLKGKKIPYSALVLQHCTLKVFKSPVESLNLQIRLKRRECSIISFPTSLWDIWPSKFF